MAILNVLGIYTCPEGVSAIVVRHDSEEKSFTILENWESQRLHYPEISWAVMSLIEDYNIPWVYTIGDEDREELHECLYRIEKQEFYNGVFYNGVLFRELDIAKGRYTIASLFSEDRLKGGERFDFENFIARINQFKEKDIDPCLFALILAMSGPVILIGEDMNYQKN